ncbi:hypothetical protein [Butyrivibrio sp. INlla21]|uniref:hypothetical protein n=1 Tax=Butyrivibrio sp. INlla21 TaxID=1520811 RepID=UPI0008F0B19B|nr:hypothetical protein [Butyrivibrio sp. INlla21]SFU36406.1 hypothetical protein SAMN02910342_00254 [Butyrivibrio sp. INlla21]
MAKSSKTTTKTTTKKTTTKSKPVVEQSTKDIEIVEEPVVEIVEKPTKVEKKKDFKSTDGVVCRSVTPGSLFVDGPKSGMLYTFAAYGDEAEIEYRDLKGLIMMRSPNIFTPRFIVEDVDFIAETPQLDAFYSKQFSTKDLRKILELPVEEMVEEIKKLPSGAQDNMKTLAATAIGEGNLDSIKKIKALDELWGTQFDAFSGSED